MGTSKNRFEKRKMGRARQIPGKPPRKAVCLMRRLDKTGGVLYTFSLKRGFLEVTIG